MQYRLSTLFLIFFMVAASLAMLSNCEDPDLAVFLGFIVIFLNIIILLAALSINRASTFSSGIIYAIIILFFGIICTGLLLPCYSKAGQAAYRAACINNLKQISFALHNYHDTNKHFPQVNTCDKADQSLYSWRVEILPMLEYEDIYNLWKKDEPWNSSTNIKILNKFFPWEYCCPSTSADQKYPAPNYIAIIGSGTAWRKDGPVKLSDLPDGGSHTIMLVEVANSGVHWAEPRDLAVDEALERMKTGKGLRISSVHPSRINVLFADGTVRSLPSKMPISLWKKILAGEIRDLDSIEEMIDESAPDMVDVSVYPSTAKPGKWSIALGIVIWLFSVVLLFRRAIKSRRKPATAIYG